MTCYYPLTGYRTKEPNENGKYPIVWGYQEAQLDDEITCCCGRCLGCLIDKSQDWAIRGVHESNLHEQNSFITLTYDEEHLPLDKSLHRSEFNQFLERLRYWLELNQPETKFLYLGCGEYGEQGRAHFHSALFGFQFPDLQAHQGNGKDMLYTSEILTQIWGKGFCTVGEVTRESVAYIARYTLKKQSLAMNDRLKKGRELINPMTGEITTAEEILYSEINKEMQFSSRNPALGKNWFLKYGNDCRKGFITLKGRKHPIPTYYEKLMDKYWGPVEYDEYFAQKKLAMNPNNPENKTERLRVREEVKKRKMAHFTRM